MMLIDKNIADRALPELMKLNDGTRVTSVGLWLKRRDEIKELLQHEEYGYIPEPPLSWSVEDLRTKKTCAGKARFTDHIMNLVLNDGTPTSFVFTSVIPVVDKPVPAILHMNFSADVPDKYMPLEEMIDEGFAIFSVCHNDVTADNDDFTSGIALAFFKGRERRDTDPGKIALWSWAESRICDYIMTLPQIDTSHICVAGHSRLGKTALVSSAFDDRFSFVAANCSGCSGDALMRGRIDEGESVERIYTRFPYWFCKNFAKYTNNESSARFDQHFLLALTAPRHLMTGSAEQDLWADPKGQFASISAASAAWTLYDIDTLLPRSAFPKPNSVYSLGGVSFHYRTGTHFFSRYDWKIYADYIHNN